MPAEHQTQKRCPVCWTPITTNDPANPNPRRYCSGACRMQDWRLRREREQTQILLEATLEDIRAANRADAEQREARHLRRALNERRSTMNPD